MKTYWGSCSAVAILTSGWLLALSVVSTPWAMAEELTVVGFNVESGGSDPVAIARRDLGPQQGVDIWGLSEVQSPLWVAALEKGAEEGENTDFKSILGSTGGDDRLAILYNSQLLDLVSHQELSALNLGGNVRAPLVAQFRLKQNGQNFLFVVNHLYRSERDLRHQQARLLNAWVKQQSLPVVAVGDYNFDYDVVEGSQGQRDQGYDLLTAESAFTWVEPQPLVATFCSTKYNSILDFVFVAHAAQDWSVKSSEVLYAEPGSRYCPDNQTSSDHRPVLATFQVPPGEAGQSLSSSQRFFNAIAHLFQVLRTLFE